MTLSNSIERYASRARFVIPAGFAFSLLFVIFGPYVNFSTVGSIDPWLYTGYFTNFANLNHQYRELYYFSRLPWTIPGLLVFQLFTPAVASILLTAGLMAVSALSLYFAIRWHYGTVPAVLAALVLATNPYFYGSIAWNYPDGPAIAYGFVAAAFAMRPNGRAALNTVLMAVFLTLSGLTNMSGGPMVLSILVFPLWRHRGSPRGLTRECVYIAAGVGGTILTLAPVSRVMLGYWTYFLKQIEIFVYEMNIPGYLTKMWGEGNGFLAGAYRLFPPAFLLIFGLVLLLVARGRKSIAWPCWLALLVCCGLYAYQEFVVHGVALRVPYHSVYLVVPLFVCCGAVLGEIWQGEIWHGEIWQGTISRRDWITSAVLVVFALAIPFLTEAMGWATVVREMKLWTDLGIAGAVTLLLLVAGWRTAPGLFRIPIVLLLVAIFYAGPLRELTVLRSQLKSNRADFDSLMKLQSVITSSLAPEKQVMFWVEERERDFPLFISESSLFVWAPIDFTPYLKTTDAAEIRIKLLGNPMIVHLTDDPAKIGERLKLMDSRGLHYENHRQWTIPYHQSQFYVAAEDLTDIFGIR